jgi:hypothetical protein
MKSPSRQRKDQKEFCVQLCADLRKESAKVWARNYSTGISANSHHSEIKVLTAEGNSNTVDLKIWVNAHYS